MSKKKADYTPKEWARVLAQKKAWAEANKEREQERKKAHYAANKEKIAAKKKAHYAANKEKIAAKSKAYYEANKEKFAARVAAYDKKRGPSSRRKAGFTPALIQLLLVKQGHACNTCKQPFDLNAKRPFHADHCHISELPRGLLCSACNTTEGLLAKQGVTSYEAWGRAMDDHIRNPPAPEFLTPKEEDDDA